MRDRLIRAGPERLADELLRIADGDDALRRRLELLAREDDPGALAGELARQIAGLRGMDRFISYGESFAFAAELRRLVQVIREKVMAALPGRSFELIDAFLLADDAVFENVDDSSGAVGEVYREACVLWLDAAARSGRSEDWVEQIRERVAGDRYGARDPLLPNAGRLLGEDELRRLARSYEPDSEGNTTDPSTEFPCDRRRGWGYVAQVAEALRDPVLYEKARSGFSRPVDDRLRLEVARLCVEWGQIDEALARLDEASGAGGYDRDSLLLECYERRGDTPRQLELLWKLFEASPRHERLWRILDLTPPESIDAARERARDAALRHRHPESVIEFLLRGGWADDAERVAIEQHGGIDGGAYTHLLELAELAASSKRPLIEVVCYRSLLRDILDDGRSKAYHHAARYYRRLEQIDLEVHGCGPLEGHTAFVAGIRSAHGRKRAFWTRVEPHEGSVR